MMREQAAAYQIKAVVAKGKSKRIGDQRAVSAKVRGHAVEIGDVERDSPARPVVYAAASGTSPNPDATSNREKCFFAVAEAMRSISLRVVPTPPNHRLMRHKSRSEVSASGGDTGRNRGFLRVDALHAGVSGWPRCREYRRSREAKMSATGQPRCSIVAMKLIRGQEIYRVGLSEGGAATLPPTLLPAVACYTGRCSSRSRREVRRGCRVRRCVRHAAPRCGRHCAPWTRGGR